MNKSERVQKMMIYLSDRTSFNLKELMDEFHISKSTALRDIESLETIGYPIYSTKGKYGGYGILHNKMTYHFEFTNEEIYALYFAMQTLQSYQTTPFHIDIEKMEHTFMTMHSKEIKDNLSRMKEIVTFETTPHNHDSPYLKSLLLYTLDNKVMSVRYRERVRTVQGISITSRFGQWYATMFDHERSEVVVFRCDRIESVEHNESYSALDKDEILERLELKKHASDTNTFNLTIDPKGIDLYYKESYPTMKLIEENGRVQIQGTYNIKELPFIVRYIAKFERLIIALEPESLLEDVIAYSTSVYKHFESLK